MQWNRNDSRGFTERILLLGRDHKPLQPAANMLFTFERKNRSTQCSFVNPASTRRSEGIVIATPAANLFTFLLSYSSSRR
jgi:hypothetical protein